MLSRWFMVGSVVTLSVGCASDQATGVLVPDEAVLANGAVEAQTTGGGKAQLPPGFTLLDFAFGALQLTNGNANGHFRQRYESSGGTVDFAGEVTCVTVDPVNARAWVGGVITQNKSTNPAALQPRNQVGRDVWFRVVDYGQGSNAVQADRTTVLGFEGDAGFITSADYCAGQPWRDNDANTWPVLNGNIQVH